MRATDLPTVPNEDCQHTQVTHFHGTYLAYNEGCRCDPCRIARKRYDGARYEQGKRHLSALGGHIRPRSEEWLNSMRRGLFDALAASYERVE